MGGYLPGTERERRDMLAALGLSRADELFAALPEGVRLKGLSLPEGLSQQGVERRVRALAAENTVYPTILRGAGAERHFIPAEVSPLNSASLRVLPSPKTSPVDFISGPKYELTSLNFSNEKTGTLTAKYGGVLCSPVPQPISLRVAPVITREAISTIETPVTLLIYGTVREARGLTSIT